MLFDWKQPVEFLAIVCGLQRSKSPDLWGQWITEATADFKREENVFPGAGCVGFKNALEEIQVLPSKIYS